MSYLHDIDPDRQAALKAFLKATPGVDAKTGKNRLLAALHKLGHVTTFEASRPLGIYGPRARKMSLVKGGHPIITSWRHVLTETGVKHRVGVYSLAR